MQAINYLFAAVIPVFIGMFMMAWYDLDHPVTKEIMYEPVNCQIPLSKYLAIISLRVSVIVYNQNNGHK